MEIKNNPITLFLTNLLTFRFYLNRDPKFETEPFLLSNNPNEVIDDDDDDSCKDWVSSRCYYDFLLPLKKRRKKIIYNKQQQQLSYVKYKELKQKKLHLDFLQEELYDKTDYDVHSIIRQLRYEQQMKKCKDKKCNDEKDVDYQDNVEDFEDFLNK